MSLRANTKIKMESHKAANTFPFNPYTSYPQLISRLYWRQSYKLFFALKKNSNSREPSQVNKESIPLIQTPTKEDDDNFRRHIACKTKTLMEIILYSLSILHYFSTTFSNNAQ